MKFPIRNIAREDGNICYCSSTRLLVLRISLPIALTLRWTEKESEDFAVQKGKLDIIENQIPFISIP